MSPQPPRPALRPPASRPMVREEPASVPPAVRQSLADAHVATQEAISALAAVYERRLEEQSLENERELQERDRRILELSAANIETSRAVQALETKIATTVATIVAAELSKKFPTIKETEDIATGKVSGAKGKTAGLSAAVSIVITAMAMAAPTVLKSCGEGHGKVELPNTSQLPQPNPANFAGKPDPK